MPGCAWGTSGSTTTTGSGKPFHVRWSFPGHARRRGAHVRVWDVATGRTARKIGDPGLAFGEMAVSPDGRSVATVGSLTGLRLWDLPSGHERRRWHKAKEELPPRRSLLTAGLSPWPSTGTMVSAPGIPRASSTCSTRTHRPSIAGGCRGDWRRLLDLEFSPDGKVLATVSDDSDSAFDILKKVKVSTRLWDVATTRELRRLTVEDDHVSRVAFTPDGRRLAAAVLRRDHPVVRPDDRPGGPPQAEARRGTPSRAEADPIRTGTGWPRPTWRIATSLAISPDGKIVAAGSHGSGSTGDAWVAGVYLWDVATGRELHRIPAHMGWTHSVSFSPDGRTLATTGTETVVRLWDVATGRESLPQSGHRSSINILAVSPADGTILTTGQDGTIREWDPATGRERGVFAQFSASISGMAIDDDGKTLLTGERFGAVKLWDVAGRREIRRFASNEPGHGIWNVAFSPNGRQVIATGPKGDWTWDLATGQEVRGAIRIGNAPGS